MVDLVRDNGALGAHLRQATIAPKPIRERFPPLPGGYRVTDATGTALAYVYAGPQGLTPAEAQAIAKAIARLPELMANDRASPPGSQER